MKYRRICVGSWEITNNQGDFHYTRLLTLYAEILKNKIPYMYLLRHIQENFE